MRAINTYKLVSFSLPGWQAEKNDPRSTETRFMYWTCRMMMLAGVRNACTARCCWLLAMPQLDLKTIGSNAPVSQTVKQTHAYLENTGASSRGSGSLRCGDGKLNICHDVTLCCMGQVIVIADCRSFGPTAVTRGLCCAKVFSYATLCVLLVPTQSNFNQSLNKLFCAGEQTEKEDIGKQVVESCLWCVTHSA